MDIVGDRKFVEIPGERLHELPPLLVHAGPQVKRMDKVLDMASKIVDAEDLLADATNRMDLAVQMAEQYFAFVSHWQWGNDVLEWIRQCEITFESKYELKHVLKADVWPHAGRSSFVTLLSDKAVKTNGVDLSKAVGLRLTFRQPPPIACFSDQFLFYLNSTVANTAYSTWSSMNPAPVSCLPPERFQFDVLDVNALVN
jgi:hypothetical protein